MHFISIMN